MRDRRRLTARERRLVGLVGDGRPDAEIAVRLGTNVESVRREIAALVAARGLAGREGLAGLGERDGSEGSGEERRRWVTPRRAMIGAVVVFAGVVGVFTALQGEGADVAGDIERMTSSATPSAGGETSATTIPTAVGAAAAPTVIALTPAPLPLAQHGEFRAYEREELEAAGFVDTGPFIAIPFNRLPAAVSSFRAGFTAVAALDAGHLNLDDEEGWHRGFPRGEGFSSTFAAGLTRTVEGVPLYMRFSAEGGSGARTRLLPAGGELAFYATDDEGPVLLLEVGTEDGEPVPSVVDILGHLWLRPAPVGGSPIADDTGEQLGVAEATVFGPLDQPRFSTNRTLCGDRPACVAQVHHQIVGGLIAPGSGTASCEDGDAVTVELVIEAFTLRFVRIGPISGRVEGATRGFPGRSLPARGCRGLGRGR